MPTIEELIKQLPPDRQRYYLEHLKVSDPAYIYETVQKEIAIKKSGYKGGQGFGALGWLPIVLLGGAAYITYKVIKS